jgi:hypothetical protein
VNQFQGNRNLAKLELSEDEIIELSKIIQKKFLDHIEELGDSL